MMLYPVYTLMPTLVYTKHTNCSIVVILCMKCQEVRSVNCIIMRCTSVYSQLFHTFKSVKQSRVERVFNGPNNLQQPVIRSLGVRQHACNIRNTPFKLFQARMTMPVARCIPQ